MLIPYISAEMAEAIMWNTSAIESEPDSPLKDHRVSDATISAPVSGLWSAASLRSFLGLILRCLL